MSGGGGIGVVYQISENPILQILAICHI